MNKYSDYRRKHSSTMCLPQRQNERWKNIPKRGKEVWAVVSSKRDNSWKEEGAVDGAITGWLTGRSSAKTATGLNISWETVLKSPVIVVDSRTTCRCQQGARIKIRETGGGSKWGWSCFLAAYSGPRSRPQYREKLPTANNSCENPSCLWWSSGIAILAQVAWVQGLA